MHSPRSCIRSLPLVVSLSNHERVRIWERLALRQAQDERGKPVRWTDTLLTRIADAHPSGASLPLVVVAVNAAAAALFLALGRAEASTAVDTVVGWCRVGW